MKLNQRRWISVIAITVAAISTAAMADVNLQHVATFGDSLTDNQGLLPLYTGLPATLYGHDPMQLVWDKNHRPGDDLSNYAVAGFTSGNVATEISLYKFNVLFGFDSNATLFQLEMGGNDILNNAALLSNNAPGSNPQADGVINTLIRNWRTDALALASGARPDAKAVLWTIPDISLTPRYWQQLNPQQQANLRAHTQRANAFIRSLSHLNNVVVLDTWSILAQFVNDPPQIGHITLIGPPAHGESIDIFADEIHPTAVSNALIANEIITQMNLKWNAGFDLYSESELIDFALNGGWRIPTPGTAGVLLVGSLVVAGPRRRRAA